MRTYEHRPFRDMATWSYDAIQAARLGLGAEMARRLDSLTQVYQLYPNGMADMMGNSGEFYIEQMGIVAVAMAEALVQDHGDVIRIGPAIPHDWTLNGTVYVRGNARITVTAIEGKVTAFKLAAASTHTFRMANPWAPGEVLTINAKAASRTYQALPRISRSNTGVGRDPNSTRHPSHPARRRAPNPGPLQSAERAARANQLLPGCFDAEAHPRPPKHPGPTPQPHTTKPAAAAPERGLRPERPIATQQRAYARITLSPSRS